MPGPKYNYLNVRDDLRIAEEGSGQISFRDGTLNISSSTDGQLDIYADTKLQGTSPTVELEGSTLVELESATAITLDGDTSVDGSHTFTMGTGLFTVGAGGLTTTGDLVRRNTKYISGAAGKIPSGFIRCSANTTLPDEGIMFLSGKSGNLTPKIPTGTIGRTLTLVYTHSGATAGFTAKISSTGFQVGGDATEYYYLTFNYPGDATTITSDGTTWYPIHPSGTVGLNWTTT